MAGVTNSGVVGYISNPVASFPKNSITVDIFGNTFYRDYEFGAGDDTGVYWNDKQNYSKEIMLFLATAMQLSTAEKFSYGKKLRSSKSLDLKILLPTKNNAIDFDFMENFIAEIEAERVAEIEAYLTAAGLKDTELTAEEVAALVRDDVEWGEYKFCDIFNQIHQGRRLKKDDHIKGNIPFVMAGVTNNGVVGYISNPVASFPKNSITVDIFGNTFYRDYEFGAGDDTGVYWNDKQNYTKEVMLFLATAMQLSTAGKFSYGKKLRSSQSLDLKLFLPTKNNSIDFDFMEHFIRAIEKEVIRGVVEFGKEKLAAYREVVKS